MMNSDVHQQKKRTFVPLILLLALALIPTLWSLSRSVQGYIASFSVFDKTSWLPLAWPILKNLKTIATHGILLFVLFLFARKNVIDPECLDKRDLLLAGVYRGVFLVNIVLSRIAFAANVNVMPDEELTRLAIMSWSINIGDIDTIIFGMALIAFLRIRKTGRAHPVLLAVPAGLMVLSCLANMILAPIVFRDIYVRNPSDVLLFCVKSVMLLAANAACLGAMVFFARRGRDYSRRKMLTVLTIVFVCVFPLMKFALQMIVYTVKGRVLLDCLFYAIPAAALAAAHFILPMKNAVPIAGSPELNDSVK